MLIKHYGYGRFCGGDPRFFQCDLDCCTEDEIALHKQDCEKWNQADKDGIKLPPESSARIRLPSGAVVVTHKYGLGSYIYFEEGVG